MLVIGQRFQAMYRTSHVLEQARHHHEFETLPKKYSDIKSNSKFFSHANKTFVFIFIISE